MEDLDLQLANKLLAELGGYAIATGVNIDTLSKVIEQLNVTLPSVSRGHYWRLDENNQPVSGLSLRQYMAWLETKGETTGATLPIARDEVMGRQLISTIFMGIDHGFGRSGPILFETMIFGGFLDQEQQRYRTYDDAISGHKALRKAAEDTAWARDPLMIFGDCSQWWENCLEGMLSGLQWAADLMARRMELRRAERL